MNLAAICASLSLCAASASAQDLILAPQQAVADVRYLQDALERTHPDPYSGFGGRVAFGRALEELLTFARSSDHGVRAFRERVAVFLANLGDGHTFVENLPDSTVPEGFLPIALVQAADGIYVSAAPDAFAPLIGSRLIAVGGDRVAALVPRVPLIYPRENESGSRHLLALTLRTRAGATALGVGAGPALMLTVETPDGRVRDLPLSYGPRTATPPRPRPAGLLPGELVTFDGPFRWAVIGRPEVGYLRVRAMQSRAPYRHMARSGRSDLPRWLDFLYSRYLQRTRPQDLDEAVAGVPSLPQEVSRLLSAMRNAGTDRLIIDLRGNDGGWSAIIPPLLFQLYGRRFLQSPSDIRFATRISAEYLALNGTTLDRLSHAEAGPVALGDYLVTNNFAMPDFLEDLRADGVEPDSSTAPPQVVVLVDGGTFSAAFDLAYELKRLGAALVGVPPAQAPRSYVDPTEFRLPNSGLKVAVSRTEVVHPSAASGPELRVDFPISGSVYRRFGFASDAAVRYAYALLRESVHSPRSQ